MMRQGHNISSTECCGHFIGTKLQLIPVRIELFVGALQYRNAKELITTRAYIFKRLETRISLPNTNRISH